MAKKIFEGMPLSKIYLNYPRNPCIVGAFYNNRINFMPASWNSPISFDPPIYGVAISPDRFTHSMITSTKAFSISYFPYDAWEIVAFLGSVSGKDVNKVEAKNIKVEWGKLLRVPIPEIAIISLECELMDMRRYGDHDWFVGKVLAIHYQEEFSREYKGRIVPNLSKYSPLLYLGMQQYITINPDSIISPPRQ